MAEKDKLHTGELFLPGDEEIVKEQTACLETLVFLSHKKPDSRIEVTVDLDESSLDQAAIAARAAERK